MAGPSLCSPESAIGSTFKCKDYLHILYDPSSRQCGGTPTTGWRNPARGRCNGLCLSKCGARHCSHGDFESRSDLLGHRYVLSFLLKGHCLNCEKTPPTRQAAKPSTYRSLVHEDWSSSKALVSSMIRSPTIFNRNSRSLSKYQLLRFIQMGPSLHVSVSRTRWQRARETPISIHKSHLAQTVSVHCPSRVVALAFQKVFVGDTIA